MESRKIWEIECVEKCGVELQEPYVTYTELQAMLKGPCPQCGGTLQQVVGFGAGRFKGPGFTRRGC